jgi:hypothetical protein
VRHDNRRVQHDYLKRLRTFLRDDPALLNRPVLRCWMAGCRRSPNRNV